MNCRVGSVHKCLTSAADICRRGNRVALDGGGSLILNKRTGEATPLSSHRQLRGWWCHTCSD